MLASFLKRAATPAKKPADRGKVDAQIMKALGKTLEGQKSAAEMIGRLRRDHDALRKEVAALRKQVAGRDAAPAASKPGRKSAGRTARAKAPPPSSGG